MSLLRYNSQWIPEVFAMRNSGVLCYLNSLVQALLCLPAFNKFLVDSELEFSADDNQLGLLLLTLFKETVRASQDSPRSLLRESIDPILRELLRRRKEHALAGSLSIGSQEDAQEGYQLLLNSIIGDLEEFNTGSNSNELESKFHIRHDTIITCKNCRVKKVSKISLGGGGRERGMPSEIFIDIPYRDVLHGYIDSQEKMQDYVNSHSSFPPDYRCENCGVVNTNDEHMVLKSYVLRRLSSVIVLVFKNYPSYKNGKKVLHYFPSGLEFKSETGSLLYQVVAKIEHSGSERGGHYIATGQRKVHPVIHKQKTQDIRNQISQKENDPRFDQEVKVLKRQLRIIDKDTAIFQMNDEHISYTDDGIVPTENTYMVFYHLM